MPDSEGFILRDPVRSGQILSGGWLIGYCSLESGSEPPPPILLLPAPSVKVSAGGRSLSIALFSFPLPFCSPASSVPWALLLCVLGKRRVQLLTGLVSLSAFPCPLLEHCKEKVVPSRPFHLQASSLWENLGVCSFFFSPLLAGEMPVR